MQLLISQRKIVMGDGPDFLRLARIALAKYVLLLERVKHVSPNGEVTYFDLFDDAEMTGENGFYLPPLYRDSYVSDLALTTIKFI